MLGGGVRSDAGERVRAEGVWWSSNKPHKTALMEAARLQASHPSRVSSDVKACEIAYGLQPQRHQGQRTYLYSTLLGRSSTV